jgi:MFS family permease
MKKINFHFLNIYVNRFLGDMVPVMPLLGLLLLEREFSLATISLFFLCLSVTIIVIEIPAGVIADLKNPRLVVITSRILKLLAFVTLLFASNVFLLCMTAILWGLSSALDSGAMQSYLFQLTRQCGKEDQFESVYGKIFTSSLSGLLAAGLIASQIALLGFVTLQYIGIVALILCLLSVLFFPSLTTASTNKKTTEESSSYLITSFRSLLRLDSVLLILLSIGIFAGGIKGSLDEYTTLLLADKELAFGVIGYIVFGLEVLRTAGAAVAARFKLPIKAQLVVLGILGLAFLAAALGNYLVAIAALVLVIFIDAILWVHNDTAIQRQASDDNRATVASIKNFGTEVLAASMFLVTWLLGEHWDTSLLYMIGGLVLLLVSMLLFFRYKMNVLSQ